jgi:hypothetical protein
MFNRGQSVCVILVSLLLTACAGVSQQSYNSSSAAPLKKILIVTQAQPPNVTVGVAGSMGLMFGPIGAGLAAANAGAQGTVLNQLITGEGLNYHQRFQEKIVTYLKAADIQSEVVSVPRPRLLDFVEDYKSLLAQHDADAVLDVVVLEAGYGGTHPMLDPDHRPILKVRAKLVSAKTLVPLYADAISFGYSNPFESAKEIKSPKQYYFNNMDAIASDKKRAAEGLGVAADEVARYITDQFVSTKTAAIAVSTKAGSQ